MGLRKTGLVLLLGTLASCASLNTSEENFSNIQNARSSVKATAYTITQKKESDSANLTTTLIYVDETSNRIVDCGDYVLLKKELRTPNSYAVSFEIFPICKSQKIPNLPTQSSYQF